VALILDFFSFFLELVLLHSPSCQASLAEQVEIPVKHLLYHDRLIASAIDELRNADDLGKRQSSLSFTPCG